MQEIKIASRYDSSKFLVCGEYESIKDCLEKNCGAYLDGANLCGAYLHGAYLDGANLCGANLDGAYLRGAYLRGAYLDGANLDGANLDGAYLDGAYLRGAYLRGAYLDGANLCGANLRGANLDGVKNYVNSHDIFQEIVKKQEVKTFTEKEWCCIGQICMHRLCWDSIKKRFGKTAMSVFKKLSKVGFDEWGKKYSEVTDVND